MSQGFGRKGVVAGVTPPSASTGFGQHRTAAADRDDGLSAAARAFLAQEHGNRGSRSDDAGALGPGHSGRSASGGERSMLLAYVLWWFAAPLGAHRFYLGAYRSAIAMFTLFWGGILLGAVMSKQSTVSAGGVFVPPVGISMVLIWIVWCLVDAFLIPGMVRRWRTAHDRPGLDSVFA